jgi:hypothetical protein
LSPGNIAIYDQPIGGGLNFKDEIFAVDDLAPRHAKRALNRWFRESRPPGGRGQAKTGAKP